MIGENFVQLTGRITRPSFKNVGQNNIGLFKGTLAIPTAKGTEQFIKVAGWAQTAEALSSVAPNATVKIHGHIEESSYESKCKHCQGPDKKYWTEVVVDNFVVVEEN